jgi:hypothetical protein
MELIEATTIEDKDADHRTLLVILITAQDGNRTLTIALIVVHAEIKETKHHCAKLFISAAPSPPDVGRAVQ